MRKNVMRMFLLTAMTVIWAGTGSIADVAFLRSTDFGSGVLDEPVAVSATDLDGDTDLDLVVVSRIGENVTVFLNDGSGNFSSSSTYTVGARPEAITIADVDNNGVDDFIVCNGGDGTVQVLLGDGSGGLVPGGTVSVGTSPVSITPCHLNLDNAVDLAVTCAGTDSDGWELWFLEGAGDATFSAQTPIEVGRHPLSIQVFDMDGDALSDFAWTNFDEDTFTVLNDSLVADSYPTDDDPIAVAVQDLDNDGNQDLLVLCEGNAKINVFAGSPTGEFTSAGTIDVSGIPHAMALTELNGSAPIDLVVLDDAGSAMRILYGESSGTYSATPGPVYVSGNEPTTLIVDMFNGDAFPDTVVFSAERSVGSFYSGEAGGSFQAARLYDVGWSPTDIVAAKLGADADTDLVVSNEDADTLSVLHGQTDGTLAPIDEVAAEFAPASLVAGQFDGTNGADIAVASLFGDTVTIFISQLDGTLSMEDSIDSVAPVDLETADTDGDGNLDLAVLEWDDEQISLMTGDGDGGFVLQGTFNIGDTPFDSVLGMFDADDVVDAAVTKDVGGNVSILIGTGDGGFASPTVVATIGNPTSIEQGLFDANGNLDLAVTDFTAGTVTILSGVGDGTFLTGTPVTVGTGPSDLFAVDIDIDRNTDILVTNRTSNNVHILSGDGAGGFAISETLYPGRSPNAVTATDLNGDGAPDVAVVNFESNTVAIYLNLTEFSNVAPTANAGDDNSVTARDNVQLDGSGSSDTDRDTITYAWTQTAGPTVVLDDDKTDDPQFTAPVVLASTTINFELVVADPFGLTDSDTVSVTVEPAPNSPPVADAGSAQSVDELALVILDGSGSSDPDDDELAYNWTRVSGPVVALSGNHTSTPAFYSPQVFTSTELVFQLIVSDGAADSTADTVTITVQNTQNEPPIALTDGDQSVNGGDTVTMDGSASSDPNGDTLTFSWQQSYGTGVTLSGGDTDSAQFTAPDVTTPTILKFQLSVGDGQAWSASDILNVTVFPAAAGRPTAHAGANATVNETAVATLDGSNSSDPNGDPMTYSWTQVDGPAVVLSDPNSLQPTFVAQTVFTNTDLTFSLIVSDATSSSMPDNVTITVLNSVNEPPVADAGANQTVGEGSTVWLDASGSADLNDDALTYLWLQTGGPDVLLINAGSESASFVAPDVTADTELTFSLTVSDGLGGGDADTISITVLHTSNDRPLADAGTDITANESDTVVLDGRASSDPEGDTLTFFWTQVAGPLVSLENAVTAQPSFSSPEVLADTEFEFSLQVSDGDEMSLADTVLITVHNSVNEPPIADAGNDLAIEEGGLVSLDGTGSSDPNGQNISYLWEQTTPDDPQVSLSDASSVSPRFTAPDVGSDTLFEFRLTVSDGIDLSEDFIRVTVLTQVAGRPVAKAGADVTVDELTHLTLDGSASYDPDEDEISFVWSQVSGPAVSLNNDDPAKPSFDVPRVTDEQKLEFSLIVVGGGLLSAPDTVCVTVKNSLNEVPVADPGIDQTVLAGGVVRLDGTGSSDENGQSLTFEWIQLSPANPVITLSDPTAVAPLFTAPEVASDTEFEFQLTVSDGIDLANATVHLTVMSAGGGRPVANAGNNQTVHEMDLVTLNGSGSNDPDGDPLTFLWIQTDGPNVTLSNPTSEQPTFDAPQVPVDTDLQFTLTVDDGEFTSEVATVSVTVTNVMNDPPVASAGPDKNVAPDSQVALDGSGSQDPNGDAITYLWTQTGGPTITLNGPTTVSPTFTAPAELLDLTFEIEVNDGTDSDTDTVIITVSDITTDPSDIDGDGKVNAIDVQKAINQALGIEPGPGDAIADANGDGKVNAVDIQTVINKALGIT